jgi:hypothetical protein
VVLMLILVGCRTGTESGAEKSRRRRISVADYVDKMKGGWIGQMAGVGWGGPTEFHARGAILPADQMPQWKPEMINQFGQDDIYVEMTFVRTLELYGMGVSIRQAGIDFANSGYPLWHANNAGRTLLRSGVAPPDSGHPKFNKHADDIDYQIESDFSGLIAPGLPNVAIKSGEKFGRLMNYGDGLYGGQLIGGMYAEAFFENDIEKIVEAGLACIPKRSQYYECISDLLRWYRENPNDWEKTWQLIEQKYQDNPDYRRASCDKGEFNIDAKINGAYIVMGLLYGKGDPDQTIVISTRCGQDSDCNPSSAAGVLFTTIGYAKLPERFKSALNPESKFSHTPYSFPTLVKVCEQLANDVVRRAGGKVKRIDGSGEDIFIIPRRKPKPSKLEQCWEPGPTAGSRFTEKEMAQITATVGRDLSTAIEKLAPGWKVAKCGEDMNPGFYEELNGKKNVLMTHPLSQTTACVLSKEVEIPAGRKTKLSLIVGHHPDGDWTLIVKADGKELFKVPIGKETTKDLWTLVEVDLSQYAGKNTKLELLNQASDWKFEAGYWAKIELVSQ